MFEIFALTVFAILPLDTHIHTGTVYTHIPPQENCVYRILMKTDDRRLQKSTKRKRKKGTKDINAECVE